MKFKYQITLPFKGVENSFQKQAWCDENIHTENWKLESGRINTQDWLFVREEDALQFALRWS